MDASQWLQAPSLALFDLILVTPDLITRFPMRLTSDICSTVGMRSGAGGRKLQTALLNSLINVFWSAWSPARPTALFVRANPARRSAPPEAMHSRRVLFFIGLCFPLIFRGVV